MHLDELQEGDIITELVRIGGRAFQGRHSHHVHKCLAWGVDLRRQVIQKASKLLATQPARTNAPVVRRAFRNNMALFPRGVLQL